jgi:hypothetical protein
MTRGRVVLFGLAVCAGVMGLGAPALCRDDKPTEKPAASAQFEVETHKSIAYRTAPTKTRTRCGTNWTFTARRATRNFRSFCSFTGEAGTQGASFWPPTPNT